MSLAQRRHTVTDALLPPPWYYAWPWAAGMDDAVAIDLGRSPAGQLAEGEAVANPACALRVLGERAAQDEDAPAGLLVGSPVVGGTVVTQRLAGLERGRLYRLQILHGPLGNRRAAGLLIEVGE